jgi:hypothetical protein
VLIKFYFQKNTKASGEIDILGCKIAAAEDVVSKQFAFGIYHPARKNVFLHCNNEEDFKDWIKVLRLASRPSVDIDRAFQIINPKSGSPKSLTGSEPMSPYSPMTPQSPMTPSSPYYQHTPLSSEYSNSPYTPSPYKPKPQSDF